MGNSFKNMCLVLSAGALLVGCDEAVIDDGITPIDDEVTFRAVVDNGVEMNGPQINGLRMNGLRMNGLRMNGLRMNGSDVNNFALTQGSKIRGLVNAIERQGAALAGSEFDMDIDQSGTIVPQRIRINNVVQSAVNNDVFFTDVRYWKTPDNLWDYLCRDGAGNPTEAIALNFAWDDSTGTRNEYPDAFTWACRGAALAKAVEWGYAPWRPIPGFEMKDIHQAAVRMIRADYCGNGITHTVNGNPIDVSDRFGIQTPGTAWPVEAKWGPDGAVCLNTPRRAVWTRAAIIAECQAAGRGTLPTCSNNDPSEYGGLLMTQANAL